MRPTLAALAALLLTSTALGAGKKPTVCQDFAVYRAEDGTALAVCHDGKRPVLYTDWQLVTLQGVRYLVGFK